MGNNDGLALILLGLGALYLISRPPKAGIRSSVYIRSYGGSSITPPEPELPATGSNIPTSLKGYKTPAQAIKYAPKGAGTVLHGTGTLKSGGGYQIR